MARLHACHILLLAALAVLAAEAKLGSNIVNDWVKETENVVRTIGIQNQLSTKYYGLVGLATYEALKAGGAPPAALAAYAGHTILSNSFPWLQGRYDVLIGKQLAGVSAADKKKAADIAVPIAAALLKERTADATTRWAQARSAAKGTAFAYQFTPGQTFSLYPQLADAKPFVLSSKEADELASGYKPPKNDYQDTFVYGAKGSKQRKQYDTDSAFFWADGANTSAISGHWLDIAREVLPELSLEDTALFFARAGAAAYDASVVAWKVKQGTLHWRPVTAFRQGYPGFKAVEDWEPLLATPPHPEYVSGHQATVGAILEVILRTLGGKDDVAFTIGSEGTPWLKRSYKSLTAAANEVGDSRLYGGVHFRSANEDGLKLGRQAGAKVYERLQPLPGSKQAGTAAAENGKKAASGRRLRA